MARHSKGWFKLHRSAWEKELSHNVYLWAIWHAFLHMATWKETKIIWLGKQRTIPPGSVVFGYREFSEKWDISKTTVKKWVQYLHDSGRIVTEVCPRGCIATICNWEIYQENDSETVPKCAQSAPTECPPSVHQVSTECPPSVPYRDIEEKKNIKNKEINPFSIGSESSIPDNIKQEWESTLAHYGKPPNWQRDQPTLYRVFQRTKDWDRVRNALIGFRREEKSEKYNPAKYCNLSRLTVKESFDHLEGLGELPGSQLDTPGSQRGIADLLAEEESKNGAA